MLYTEREITHGNKVLVTSNRLQYANNETKLSIVTQLFDRGLMTPNQGLEVFNLPPVPDGDKRYIRKEYAEISRLNEAQGIGGDGNAGENAGAGISGNAANDSGGNQAAGE
jgi:hypothetical protein